MVASAGLARHPEDYYTDCHHREEKTRRNLTHMTAKLQ